MSLKIEMFDKDNNRVARLLEDLEYKVISSDNAYYIKIKKGFEYDGASIPKIFWWLIGSPFSGKYRLAATVHDALYATQLLSKDKADDIFYNIMIEDGVSKWKALLMYSAVKAGGYFAYNDATSKNIDIKFVEVREIR